MLWAACEALSQCAPIGTDGRLLSLLPPLSESLSISKKVALAVAKKAMEQNLCRVDPKTINLKYELNYHLWEPKYHKLKLVKNID